MDRRELLTKLAAAGAVAATSSSIASSPAFAAAGSCCTAADSCTLIGTCIPNTTVVNGCRQVFSNTITACRATPTSTMTISRTAAGAFRPYFDEVGILTVTSPTGVTRSQNYIGWQNNCRSTTTTLPDLTGYGDGNGNPCSNPANDPTDVTALFGNECGLFTVRIDVRNGFTPYGYSTCYLRGS